MKRSAFDTLDIRCKDVVIHALSDVRASLRSWGINTPPADDQNLREALAAYIKKHSTLRRLGE